MTEKFIVAGRRFNTKKAAFAHASRLFERRGIVAGIVAAPIIVAGRNPASRTFPNHNPNMMTLRSGAYAYRADD